MTPPLLTATIAWLQENALVQSAVLFGSTAATFDDPTLRDASADIDLHIVSPRPGELEHVPWSRCFPGQGFCLQAVRPATGGVRKATVIFDSGQLDLVLVPSTWMHVATVGLRLRLERRSRAFATAVNEMATCLHSGYRFLKGEPTWGRLYQRVAALPGVRLSDAQITAAAGAFLCDLLWVLQKLERGEVVAAQHIVHTRLQDTNLRLWRELRRRQAGELPSFGLGRRIETLGSEKERALLTLNGSANVSDLRRVAWQCLAALEQIMAGLVAAWCVPPAMRTLLERHHQRR